MAGFGSSRSEVFCKKRCSVKKGVLWNFTKFTGNTCARASFFNKVAGLRPATILKKRLWQRCFLVNFAKFLGAPFYWIPLLMRFLYEMQRRHSGVSIFNFEHIFLLVLVFLLLPLNILLVAGKLINHFQDF